LIHGDYDCGWRDSYSAFIFTLKEFGVEPVYFIPDRLTEGYGLGESGVGEGC